MKQLWRNLLRWLPVILWMGLIYYLSAQPAQQSSELSSVVMQWLLRFVEDWFAMDTSVFHFVVRKGAHILAYLVLAVLVRFALKDLRICTACMQSTDGSVCLRTVPKAKERTSSKLTSTWRQAVIAFAICVLYAASDEVHQLFVPGRSGQVSDVGIDAVGALIGIGVYPILQTGLQRLRSG